MNMRVLDSHVHFFDPSRPGGIDWPAIDSPLFGQALPSSLFAETNPLRPDACIAVETSRRPADDDWLMNLANRQASIKGVVLNLQPDTPGFEQRFDSAMAHEKFVGIRFRPIEQYDFTNHLLHQSITMLETRGKTIEFGAKTALHKDIFAQLARQYRGITWILDHGGHPPINGNPDDEWLVGMCVIAANPNAVVKVTNLAENPEGFRSIFRMLLEIFGPHRLLYGSNWPVCTQSENDVSAAVPATEFLGDAAAAFFEGNAWRIYSIKPERGEPPLAGNQL